MLGDDLVFKKHCALGTVTAKYYTDFNGSKGLNFFFNIYISHFLTGPKNKYRILISLNHLEKHRSADAISHIDNESSH